MIHLDLGGDDPATLHQLGSFLYNKEWGNYCHESTGWVTMQIMWRLFFYLTLTFI
jgi:hypothetical protein